MSVIVEEIPLPDGGRVLIYDDGSEYEVHGTAMVMREGPHSADRGADARAVLAAATERATPPRTDVDPSRSEDLQWLRERITSGNITRATHAVRSVPPDSYLIVLDQGEWSYRIGQRHHVMIACHIRNSGGSFPLYETEMYPWGPRGSEAARAAWRRDFAREHPYTAALASDETETALADTGIPPAAVDLYTPGPHTASEIGAAIMNISRAALAADSQIATAFQRFVAQYNGDGLPGAVLAIVAGVIEFAVRFVVGIAALPAALEMLFTEAGNILTALQESLPDILEGLRESPVETLVELGATFVGMLSDLTGLSDIGTELSAGVRALREGRSAESALHFTRAVTRLIDLILLVRALVTGLRRLPAVVRRMRRTLSVRITRLIRRLRDTRAALRGGGLVALEEAGDASRTGAHGHGTTTDAPDSPEPPASSSSAADELVDESHPPPSHGSSPDAEGETPHHTEEPGAPAEPEPAPDSTASALPPSFSRYLDSLNRLLTALHEGGEMLPADLDAARALRQILEQHRTRGHIPEPLHGSFFDMERQIDVIEGASHNSALAARGADIVSTGGTATTAMIGAAGEEIVRRILVSRGYRNVMAIINRANNGLDVFGIDRFGRLRFFEVKASAGGRAPSLSAAQRNARSFVMSRLNMIEGRRGVYASATDTTRATARQLLQQLDRQSYVGGIIFEFTHVFDLSRMRLRVRPWHGTVGARSSAWWSRLFRLMGESDH